MNIHRYKLKLKKARDMLKNMQERLNNQRGNRRKNRDEIEMLFNRIKKIRDGMINLRNKIKDIKNLKGKKK